MTNEQSKTANRLINETSPYLLQHAHNPVDWYPWGSEAFEKARSQNKPIFLSIGYSTCHWCHVMERESFENPDTTALMNELFVCIKVDREERPDVDEVYMQAAQLLTGQGGWPLSVFLDLELRPFYAGTYFPPVDAHGRPGFPRLLQALAKAFHERPEDVAASASDLVGAINQNAQATAQPGEVSRDIIERAAAVILRNLDEASGGFGQAPKFPCSMALRVQLRHYHRSGDARYLDAVTLTLDNMVRGGIFDQIGGGFHRYSTDDRWLVPHFEKMLYDNALMLEALVEAWQVTRSRHYAEAADSTVAFLLREMLTSEGAFASAIDADSEGVEGLFYVWTPEEVRQALGGADGQRLCSLYGITDQGNFEQGRSIPHLRVFPDATDETTKRLPAMRERLLDVRNERVRPSTDDKAIVSWNGLAIGAVARFGRVFENRQAIEAARTAAEAILELVNFHGGLGHSLRAGQVSGPAYQEDYACLAGGLVDLYEATGDASFLRQAHRLLRSMIERFWDDDDGGFFFSEPAHETPLVRSKNPTDGVTPSGNSSAALAMARVSRLLDEPLLHQRALETVKSLAGLLGKAPRAFENLLLAADFLLAAPQEIVIAGSPDEQNGLTRTINSSFLADAVLAWSETEGADAVAAARGKGRVEGKDAVYLCRNYSCQAPATTVEDLRELLAPLNPSTGAGGPPGGS